MWKFRSIRNFLAMALVFSQVLILVGLTNTPITQPLGIFVLAFSLSEYFMLQGEP
jgi:hypothetical protein